MVNSRDKVGEVDERNPDRHTADEAGQRDRECLQQNDSPNTESLNGTFQEEVGERAPNSSKISERNITASDTAGSRDLIKEIW